MDARLLSQFKTNDQYGFHSLKFTNDVLEAVKMYMDEIRPWSQSKCEFVAVTTSGTQYTAFCNVFSLLTHEVIGKHITSVWFSQSEIYERCARSCEDVHGRNSPLVPIQM